MQMSMIARRRPAVDAWSETALPDTIHDYDIILALTIIFCLS
jgi:hypothetical protein